ncbi:MAG: Mur ligase family protein, partial [Gammaproteobacteria bacterium]
MPGFTTLSEWLSWQETLHPHEIELGLERIHRVYQRLHDTDLPTVITVAGTNGKGSSVALLEAIYRQAGYRTGSYTSPHLLRYNERIAIQGEPQSDRVIIEAFNRVDHARQQESLTYFEFGTLAALDIFHRSDLDVVLLETGLGGRLDAVNIIDADAAIVTTVDLDHQAWLGNDRATIAKEKAGIFRAAQPAISSDPASPEALQESAKQINANWLKNGEHFFIEQSVDHWLWRSGEKTFDALPYPALIGAHQINNAAGVLMAIHQLDKR